MADILLAEFESPDALARAVYELREQGYRDLDAHTPYSTEPVREAIGRPRSRLPYAVFVGGMLGAGAAYLAQWYLVAYLYPLDVGGRPPHFPLAFVPITFEMGVLAAAFTAFFGVLFAGRLFKLWDPVFEAEGFESSSIDRFWLRMEAVDPRFEPEAAKRLALELGARRVTLVGGATA